MRMASLMNDQNAAPQVFLLGRIANALELLAAMYAAVAEEAQPGIWSRLPDLYSGLLKEGWLPKEIKDDAKSAVP